MTDQTTENTSNSSGASFTVKYNDENKANKVPKLPVIEIISKTHFELLLKKYPIVLLKVHGEWCVPCKFLAPEFELLARKYSHQPVGFLSYNIDRRSIDLDAVTALPCVIFYVDGIERRKVFGANINDIKVALLNTISKY